MQALVVNTDETFHGDVVRGQKAQSRARDKDHEAAAAEWSEDDKVRWLTDDPQVPVQMSNRPNSTYTVIGLQRTILCRQ